MNFFDYINVPKELFEKAYIDTDLVQRQKHDTFPLDIYCYGRKAVHEDYWDGVTAKCRGIIVNRETGDIVARPFEKFHNYGSKHVGDLPEGNPVVLEKLDGFMATLYQWDGHQYIASKGSFHSVHAKWATAKLREHGDLLFIDGWTPVFEGLCRDLRIVVDYGEDEGLVLLGVINNEDGRELSYEDLQTFAKLNNLEVVEAHDFTLQGAVDETLREFSDGLGTDEGFVVTWYNGGIPTRVKLKYIDYLRLHRLVTGVSPKRIWGALSQPQLKAEIDEYLNNSTPWFKHFVEKWIRAMRQEYDRIAGEVHTRFQVANILVKSQYEKGEIEFHEIRKAYALQFTNDRNKEFSGILFTKLDSKNVDEAIWKKVKGMTLHGHPLREAQFT